MSEDPSQNERDEISDLFYAILSTSYCVHERELLRTEADRFYKLRSMAELWVSRDLPAHFYDPETSSVEKSDIIGVGIEFFIELQILLQVAHLLDEYQKVTGELKVITKEMKLGCQRPALGNDSEDTER